MPFCIHFDDLSAPCLYITPQSIRSYVVNSHLKNHETDEEEQSGTEANQLTFSSPPANVSSIDSSTINTITPQSSSESIVEASQPSSFPESPPPRKIEARMDSSGYGGRTSRDPYGTAEYEEEGEEPQPLVVMMNDAEKVASRLKEHAVLGIGHQERIIFPTENDSSLEKKREDDARGRQWKEIFYKVKAYTETKGNINDIHHGFRRWVNTQRDTYRQFCKTGDGAMTVERVKLLESIGINWERHDKLKDIIWREKFDKLVANGNVNDVNHDLTVWVNTQRVTCKEYHRTGKGGMTEERIKLLESIGIDWEPGISLADREVMWRDNFEDLKVYKSIHGHTNVPRKPRGDEHFALGRWVAYQRTKYRKNTLKTKKIQVLESIGFAWYMRSIETKLVRKRKKDDDGH